MTTTIDITIESKAGTQTMPVTIEKAVIAGWTGRDAEAVEKHIVELEAVGVARPATVPVYYRVSANRMTTAGSIEVSGGESSGEVEFAMLASRNTLFVGVGSDHTDRQVETYNVTVSKQMCDKPLAAHFWPFDEVADHWDALTLTSWLPDGTLYQQGSVTAMRAPQELIAGYEAAGLADGTVMFCGTLSAIGGIRPAPGLCVELHDPVLGRSIRHEYAVVEMPVL